MFRIDKLGCYDMFHCVMGACPENCCEMNWKITVDNETYKRYAYSEDERLQHLISKEEPHVILKKDNHCPFFMENGLCFLHKEYGEDFLGETCKNYPRFASAYENLYVLTLAMSCPAVLNLIWEEEGAVKVNTRLFYEQEEEVGNRTLPMSEQLVEKIKLRDAVTQEWMRHGNLEEKMERIEEKWAMGANKGFLEENIGFIKKFVMENCLINDKMALQAERIKRAGEEIEDNKIKRWELEIAEKYPLYGKFFAKITYCWLFEHIMMLTRTDKESVACCMEKVRLLMATIQYWLLLLYGAGGSLDKEDCSITVYSMMRVLDHSEKVMEEYYQYWRNNGKIPAVLW